MHAALVGTVSAVIAVWWQELLSVAPTGCTGVFVSRGDPDSLRLNHTHATLSKLNCERS